MNEIYLPLISGLVGAIIGSLSSIATIIIQSHFQHKRELTKIATDAAITNFQLLLDHAQKEKKAAEIPPLSLFISYQVEFMKLIDKGKLTPETYKKLSDEFDKYDKFVKRD
jgi:hypothetical protein